MRSWEARRYASIPVMPMIVAGESKAGRLPDHGIRGHGRLRPRHCVSLHRSCGIARWWRRNGINPQRMHDVVATKAAPERAMVRHHLGRSGSWPAAVRPQPNDDAG